MPRKLRICCIICALLLFVTGIAFEENQQDNIIVTDELPFKVVLFVIICAFCVVCVLGVISYFSQKSYENELEKKQKNFCGECGCYCACDADCNGDVRKCTSRKAIEKGCTHCCSCWHYPFAKKYVEERNRRD